MTLGILRIAHRDRRVNRGERGQAGPRRDDHTKSALQCLGFRSRRNGFVATMPHRVMDVLVTE